MDVAHLCSELVAIRSENPPGATRYVIYFLADYLEGLGLVTEISEYPGNRCNLTTGPKKSDLLFCGHVDTVPALDVGWDRPPFSGVVENGMVHGRGATDMKGGVAAMVDALAQWIETENELPAQLALVCDEEAGSEFGIVQLLKSDTISPCDCIIAEPTPQYSPCIGQKGVIRLKAKFEGIPGHGSLYPYSGTSAIAEACSFISVLHELSNHRFPADPGLEMLISHSGVLLEEIFGIPEIEAALRSITFNPGIVSGGEGINVVAQQCTLDAELRVPWGCSTEKILQVLRRKSSGTIEVLDRADPSLILASEQIVTETCQAIQEVCGHEGVPFVQWAASDARFLRAAGFRAIEYGPGEIKTIHGTNECVRTKDLKRASDVYYSLLGRYAGS